MSDVPGPVNGPPPPPRHGCLTALMILVGIVLLLPGLCAVLFGTITLFNRRNAMDIMPFVSVGLAVGAAGVALIWAAIRGRRR